MSPTMMDSHNSNNHVVVSHLDSVGVGGDRRPSSNSHNKFNSDHRHDDDDDSRGDRRHRESPPSRHLRHHHHHDRSRSRDRLRRSSSNSHHYYDDADKRRNFRHHHDRHDHHGDTSPERNDYGDYYEGRRRHDDRHSRSSHHSSSRHRDDDRRRDRSVREHHHHHRRHDDDEDRHYKEKQKQQQQQQQQQSRFIPHYEIVRAPRDELLGDDVQDDPRGSDPTQRITKKASSRGNGRNTESFDPASTLIRPDLRVLVGSNNIIRYNRPLKHDDVVIVPELFGQEDDWSLYYKLVAEVTAAQKDPISNRGSEWISWHEGAHLIAKNVNGSETYKTIVDRMCEYFNIDKDSNIGTRFNWYRDSSDWKPFHHDSAAFNPQRAKNQNITVGASFGSTRELAFIRTEEYKTTGDKCRLYFPQVNNGVFSFGRDANILWKHGVTALPPAEQDGKGRISIILWGLARDAIEEEGSPPLLGSDGRGPHATTHHHHHHRPRQGGESGFGNGSNGGGSGKGGGGDRGWGCNSHPPHHHHDLNNNTRNNRKADRKNNHQPPRDQENLPPNRE